MRRGLITTGSNVGATDSDNRAHSLIRACALCAGDGATRAMMYQILKCGRVMQAVSPTCSKRLRAVIGTAAFGVVIGWLVPASGAQELPPNLHIVREGQNASQVRVLKQARTQCVSEKRMYLDMRRTKPDVWDRMEQDMKKRRRAYDLAAPTAAEPDWSTVAIKREEEYFQGEKYARITDSTRYRIANDGTCALVVDKTQMMVIDDGTHHFEIDVAKGTGVKRPSATAIHRQLPAAGGDGQAAGSDTVAGERCDYLVASRPLKGAKLCYWSKMHRYPSTIRRPVILKSMVKMGNDTNIEQAVLFEQPRQINASVFQPPPGIKLRETGGR